MKVNSATAWIDGSSIYGPSASWSDSLRSFSGGLLASGPEWKMPRQAERRTFMWSAADPCTAEHGAQGLHGETVLFDLIMVCHRGLCWDHGWSEGKDSTIWSQRAVLCRLQKVRGMLGFERLVRLPAWFSRGLLSSLLLHESVGIRS